MADESYWQGLLDRIVSSWGKPCLVRRKIHKGDPEPFLCSFSARITNVNAQRCVTVLV
jgi:hypothetical protein